MQLISPDFLNGGSIPAQFTCDGNDINPTLEISGIPKETKSLAFVLDDPDAPSGTFTHWIVWNIPPVTDKILPGTLPVGSIEGLNSAHMLGYIGPCPPVGTHNYIFTLYALDATLDDLDPQKTGRGELFDKMTGHIIASTELVGLYCRVRK
ncbi:YbhB/YbcL family Raf kinase inhibitor-like protein [Candidatus Parcubacteria bacterium]|nr:YbhB/YbcL family Raf kinase inhibitor-like protein [Candidatus Parcubacteria bacterium]